jgi:Zn finger protein HypA/HybF involved in hydrogenase expression
MKFTTKDLQQMSTFKCLTCTHHWIAPTAVLCPQCHRDAIRKLETRVNVLPRV